MQFDVTMNFTLDVDETLWDEMVDLNDGEEGAEAELVENIEGVNVYTDFGEMWGTGVQSIKALNFS